MNKRQKKKKLKKLIQRMIENPGIKFWVRCEKPGWNMVVKLEIKDE